MSAAGAVQRAFGRTPVYRRAMDRAYSPRFDGIATCSSRWDRRRTSLHSR